MVVENGFEPRKVVDIYVAFNKNIAKHYGSKPKYAFAYVSPEKSFFLHIPIIVRRLSSQVRNPRCTQYYVFGQVP